MHLCISCLLGIWRAWSLTLFAKYKSQNIPYDIREIVKNTPYEMHMFSRLSSAYKYKNKLLLHAIFCWGEFIVYYSTNKYTFGYINSLQGFVWTVENPLLNKMNAIWTMLFLTFYLMYGPIGWRMPQTSSQINTSRSSRNSRPSA